jgi:hypothetical protein
VRFVQVAQRGHLEAEEITALSDARELEQLCLHGDYKFSDELRTALDVCLNLPMQTWKPVEAFAQK